MIYIYTEHIGSTLKFSFSLFVIAKYFNGELISTRSNIYVDVCVHFALTANI